MIDLKGMVLHFRSNVSKKYTNSIICLVIVSMMMLVIFSGCTEKQMESVTEKLPVKILKNSSKNVTATNTTNTTKDTLPPSQVSHLMINKAHNWINWSWDNPADKDLSHMDVYMDGKFKTKIIAPKNYYNMTGLRPNTQYKIGIMTVDLSGNTNPEWVNASTSTGPTPRDEVPPDKVWYLESHVGTTWINWTWDNPADEDYSYANIFIDGAYKTNVSKPKNFYNLTKLVPGETHTISVRTVDRNKNMNLLAVIGLATTLE